MNFLFHHGLSSLKVLLVMKPYEGDREFFASIIFKTLLYPSMYLSVKSPQKIAMCSDVLPGGHSRT